MPSESKPEASALKQTILELLDDGEASVVETDGKIIRRIKATKLGQKQKKDAIINKINKFLIENEFVEEKTKRIYRRKMDLFDPGAGPEAEINKLSSKLTPRVSRQHVASFNACAARFANKREALERAVELLAQDAGVRLDPDHE